MLFDIVMIFITYTTLCSSAMFAFGNVTNETCQPTPGNLTLFIIIIIIYY